MFIFYYNLFLIIIIIFCNTILIIAPLIITQFSFLFNLICQIILRILSTVQASRPLGLIFRQACLQGISSLTGYLLNAHMSNSAKFIFHQNIIIPLFAELRMACLNCSNSPHSGKQAVGVDIPASLLARNIKPDGLFA